MRRLFVGVFSIMFLIVTGTSASAAPPTSSVVTLDGPYGQALFEACEPQMPFACTASGTVTLSQAVTEHTEGKPVLLQESQVCVSQTTYASDGSSTFESGCGAVLGVDFANDLSTATVTSSVPLTGFLCTPEECSGSVTSVPRTVDVSVVWTGQLDVRVIRETTALTSGPCRTSTTRKESQRLAWAVVGIDGVSFHSFDPNRASIADGTTKTSTTCKS